jgi:hypothetical protein
MLFVVWAFPESRRPKVWATMLGVALLGILGVIGLDLFSFFSNGGQLADVWMRAIFSVIMSTDIPVVALAVGSVVNWVITRRQRDV